MENCEKYLEMISCLVDGELDQQDEEKLLKHIETCKDCKRVYEAFKSVSETMEDDMKEPPEMLAKGIMFKIKAHEQGGKRHFAFGKFTTLAACFAILLLGASKLGLFDMGKSNSAESEPQAYMQETEGIEMAPDFGDEALDNQVQFKEKAPEAEGQGENLEQNAPDTDKTDKNTEETGMGDGIVELMGLDSISNSENIEEDSLKVLTCAEEISLYEGGYPTLGDEKESKKPLVTIKDKDILSTLSVLLGKVKPEESTDENIPKVPDEEPIYSVFIPAVADSESNSVDIVISLWTIDGKLWCEIQKEDETKATSGDISTGDEENGFYKAAAIPEEWDTFITYLKEYFAIEK